jgi:hypothetical protein
MWKRIDNLKISEFDNILKIAKEVEIPNKFKATLKGGIDIFFNGRKVAMIYYIFSSTRDFNKGDIILNTDVFDRRRDITPSERIKLGEQIWEDLIKKHEEIKNI